MKLQNGMKHRKNWWTNSRV